MAFNKLVDGKLSADDIKLLRLVDPNFQRFALPERIESLQGYAPVYVGEAGDSDTVLGDAGATDFETVLTFPQENQAGDLIRVRCCVKINAGDGANNCVFDLKLGSATLQQVSLATPEQDDFAVFDVDVIPFGDDTAAARNFTFGTENDGSAITTSNATFLPSLAGEELKVTCTWAGSDASNIAELLFIGFTQQRPQTEIPEVPTVD